MIRISLLIQIFTAFFALTVSLAGSGYAENANGNWRAQLGQFNIGVVNNQDADAERQRLNPFRFAARQTLGLPVKISVFPNYETLIKAQLEARIEYAVYSASAFATSWNRCQCIQPLVAPVASDGATGFRSVLLANRSEAATVEALSGKTVLLPGRFSFAGYLFPRDQLAQQGVKLEGGEWKTANRQSMEVAVADLLLGKGVALFGWEPYYKKPNAPNPLRRGTLALFGADAEKFMPIWKSAPVPFGPHTVRSDLDERAKLLLWDLMLGLKEKNPPAFEAISSGYTGGFRQVTRSEYQPVIRFMKNSKREQQ